MDKACKNCRFCVYAHSGGKDKPYCERHSQYIGDTILCSCWEMVSVPKPQTNADRVRSMTDEELAELFANDNCGYCRLHDFCFAKGCSINCEDVWLDWLKQEVSE